MILVLSVLGCLTPEPAPDGPCHQCHGTAEVSVGPPAALGGVTDPAHRGVGAHERHRAPHVSRVVGCEECHAMPASVDAPGHVDTPWPAEVGWANGQIAGTRAEPFDAEALTCVVYCHTASGGSDPEPPWVGGEVSCASCHGDPPPTPSHGSDEPCATCHVLGGPGDPERHVDGVVQYDLASADCGACHGAPPPPPHPDPDLSCPRCHGEGGPDNPGAHPDGAVQMNADQVPCFSCHGVQGDAAPPLDTFGRSDTALVTVGAHQTHVDGTATSAAVPCEACHVVPAPASDPGHLDPAPAEVLPGVGWDSPSCTNACHSRPGAANPDPVWTVVDGTEAECGDCHGVPPPTPVHDGVGNCACHGAGGPDDPARHVDGTVDL